MHRFISSCGVVLAALVVAACAAEPDLTTADQAVGDPVLDQLEALPGVTVTELAPRPDARQFLLLVTQPVDHFRPEGPTFQQRVLLRHRGFDVTTTLATTGYGLFQPVPRDNEISFLLRGNAFIVEHRYFEESVPSPADPRFLTIRQSAEDFHRVTQLLRPLYTGAWIGTGASKGGMTSIYHRRFYPDDVDATVAYVAPQSYTTNDLRYQVFLERVGSPECRQRIIDMQRALLDRRAEILPIFEAQAADFGITYNQAGGLELAYEHGVQEFRFALWQFTDEEFCSFLPLPGDPADDLALFLDFLSGPSVLASDQTLDEFGPYYYQASVQLGSYGPLELHIRNRLEHPGTYRVQRYSTLPVGNYDPRAIADIQLWLATQGERILLVYGENDPWSSGAFHLGFARDSLRLFVPAGNHGASIGQLPDELRAQALDALTRWAGVAPLAATGPAPAPLASDPAVVDDSDYDRQRHQQPL